MKHQKLVIMNSIMNEGFSSQSKLAKTVSLSLGTVNACIHDLIDEGYLTLTIEPTEKAFLLASDKSPRSAIILAAGAGLRMVPINMDVSKGMLEVNDIPLVERLIIQLHTVGIKDIIIVTGFLCEQYEYLIDKYQVHIIINSQYASKNNLHSLFLAKEYLSNAYIIPCDLYCFKNMFQRYELYPWYLIKKTSDFASCIEINRKMEVYPLGGRVDYGCMIGIAYITKGLAPILSDRLSVMDNDSSYTQCFWEEAIWNSRWERCSENAMRVRYCTSEDITSVDTYEDLRALDGYSGNLKSEVFSIIMQALHVTEDEIKDITISQRGMTNRSFIFTCKGKKFIMRIPGEGTDLLMNRYQEADVYRLIRDKDLSDHVLYFDPQNGYKLSEYLENARMCDVNNEDEIRHTVLLTRSMHRMKLTVPHVFDPFERLEFYESLRGETPCIYRDYGETKESVLQLRTFIEKNKNPYTLTHLDAVAENYLISLTEDGDEKWSLIDWEYASMQDPLLDIAHVSLYMFYDKDKTDWLLDIYFDGMCPIIQRILTYCYISVSGLMWSNWCEYKRTLGIEFSEYSFNQYHMAKKYYHYATTLMEKSE